MVSKVNSFAAAGQKVITYGQVMDDLNYITKTADDDFARFYPKLKDVNNKTVCGFVFEGAGMGMKLSQLLDKLGVKYSHHYPEPTPHHGELHIDAKFATMALDLFSNWASNITVERQVTGNKKLDDNWLRVVAHQRQL